MEEVLVDTSAWILSFKTHGYSNVKLYVRDLIMTEAAVITGMIKLELLQGAKSETEAATLLNHLNLLKNIEPSTNVWESVASLFRKLRKKGVTPSIPDLWISLVALENKLILLHCDKDFEQIARYLSLKTLPVR